MRAVEWPFLVVGDRYGRSVSWALVNGPIVTRGHHAQLAALSRWGYRFAGMASYMAFPRPDRRDLRDYGNLCEVWCHCFREPDRYLPSSAPRALISVSDFTDYRRVSPGVVQEESEPGEVYDFLYVGAVEAWKRRVKNWALASRCVPRLCKELGLRALVIGVPTPGFSPSPEISFSPPLPWEIFLAKLRRARFLLVPNVLDASPRMLAEAMCLDVPIVVHRRIFGGWKYVNAFTGTFFNGEHDVVAAVDRCLAQPTRPRSWFRGNYGPYLAGRRLLRLLALVDSRIVETSHLSLTDTVEIATSGLPR